MTDLTSKHVLDPLLLDDNGRLRLLPAAAYQEIDRKELRTFAHAHAIYVFPTVELVAYIKAHLGSRSAIEIGAGNNALGHHLGIPMTDNCYQASHPAFRQGGPPPTRPPEEVVKMAALEAIAHYRPHVVVAAWVTHRWQEGMQTGSEWGVDEEALLDQVDEYVFIGNNAIHWEKPIMVRSHETLHPNWIVSRASLPEEDRIFIWPGEVPA